MAQFRTKARAVELLGKGQISDLPTAISELWKNGYDAYGDKLEAFLYLEGYEGINRPLFVMSDDGKGMTKDDILEKWIVLGTDSKSRGLPDVKGPETLNKEPRIKMGEKGIGRLSVAYLGSQMLMLTKKIGSPTQSVFFDWRVLDNYNQYLEDIIIPVKEVDSIKSFGSVFHELKKEYLLNFKIYKEDDDDIKGKEGENNNIYEEGKINENDPWFEQVALRNDIIKSCKTLTLPSFFEDEILSSIIGFDDNTHGTKFVIFNPDAQILLIKNADRPNLDDSDGESINHTRSSLIGLFNTFKGEKKDYNTHFWIVENTGKRDFILKNEFFNASDFNTCDHLIDGSFNESGVFTGELRIFEKTLAHTFKTQRVLTHNKTSYGPLNLKLGYVQGDISQTPLLSGELRDNVLRKLDDFGGLYIYRDGFRILPYGRPTADFLEFEKRRSKRAGTYFFSYRRMFGYMEISREQNKKLIDKAGREGFVNNTAYSDFITDLKAFFIDLAKTYFADDAKDNTKSEQQNNYVQLIKNEKQEKEREKRDRAEFASKLSNLPKELSHLENDYNSLIAKLQEKLEQHSLTYEEISQLIKELEDCKIRLENLNIAEPVRFKPTELQRQKFHDYKKKFKTASSKVLANDSSVIRIAYEKLKEQELLNEFHNRAKQYKASLENTFGELSNNIRLNINRLQQSVENDKVGFSVEYDQKLEQIIPKNITRNELNNSIRLIERIYLDIKKRAEERLSPFLSHLSKISLEINEDDLMGYYKLKYEEIKHELDESRELSQLGIAVEIIDHEFNVLYSQLSETISSVQNEVSEKKYKMLSLAFEHLENNYKLLQPLYRTSGRIRKDITGLELFNYGEQFFSSKFIENSIEYRITAAAKEYKVYSYESIFKAVLINILNNAIYWTRSSPTKLVEIDSEGSKLIVRNSGEPIEDYLVEGEDIFKMFWSKRPQGRGIGLYLAKRTLEQNGYNIYATNDVKYNGLNGACFIVEPK